jgi:hypothetical protein
MARVVVEEAPQEGGGNAEDVDMGGSTPGTDRPRRGVWREVEVEREVTKRQLIQSITTVVVVILYMVFTLMREREAGVVVVDPDDSADDWVE